MAHQVKYATVTEALNQLKEKGYTINFRLSDNGISCDDGTFSPEHFEIREVFRYEGPTDPADEATVYAIESNESHKGVLVTGYVATSNLSGNILGKLSFS